MEKSKERNDPLCKQCDDRTDCSTEKRIKKLESSIGILFGLFIGHLLGEIIGGLLQLS